MIPRSKLIFPSTTACNSLLHLLSFCIFCFSILYPITLVYQHSQLERQTRYTPIPILLPSSYALASMSWLAVLYPSSLRLSCILHLFSRFPTFITPFLVTHIRIASSSIDLFIWIEHGLG